MARWGAVTVLPEGTGGAGMGTIDCLADDAAATTYALGPDPAPGHGYW